MLVGRVVRMRGCKFDWIDRNHFGRGLLEFCAGVRIQLATRRYAENGKTSLMSSSCVTTS